ncbi:hypothetical protein GGD63_006956 [Bradyrhizobium sp. cir1]|uniref:metallophosphoesterase n=1 Tax=Bradyrhizobium sp. cir1 TaxID=1445730 RepID=UPI001605F791|nr:metallophosphoesterase [Bradyrhizobium sp. cir1]MBB4374127.1 hypothetical protein [Bradyrhizobium sp. cir1]
MRIQIFSDLHADILPIKHIVIAENIDAVVVAGDTAEGALRAFERLRLIVPVTIPIIMVMGNHEYYRRFLPPELEEARALAPSFNVHLLEDAAVVLGGVRFLGATLWTDYRLFGDSRKIPVMQTCAAAMNDHRRIGWLKKPWRRFRPQEAVREIIVGERMPPAYLDRLTDIVRKQFGEIPIRTARRPTNSYTLIIE